MPDDPKNPFLSTGPQQGDNPFISGAPQQGNPFVQASSPQEIPTNDTAIGRKQLEIQNIQDNIVKLKAIRPANNEQAIRIRETIKRLEAALPTTFTRGVSDPGRNPFDNLIRGGAAGFAKGILFSGLDLVSLPFEITGLDKKIPGFEALKKAEAEAKENITEVNDPQGGFGAAGDFAGNIVGSAPVFGGAARATGEAIVARFPGSAIGKAVKAAEQGGASMFQRATANVASGLPINVAQGLAAGQQEVPVDATPEQRAAIERQNLADKATNVALGILADALFGAIVPGKKAPGESKSTSPTLSPERQAQFDALKNKAESQVAARNRINQIRRDARTQWQQENPGQNWKDLNKNQKAKLYEEAIIRQDAADAMNAAGYIEEEPPTTDPNLDQVHTEYRKQITDLNNRLKEEETRRNEVERLSRQDPLMGIGNGRALRRAINRVDTDPNLVWIFFDSNGMKSINDTFGHEVGDKMLLGNRDALIRSLREHGIEVDPEHAGNIFRPSEGGDELVAAVPRDKAQSILARAEEYSNQQFDNLTGNMSGAIYDTYAEGMGVEGNARLQARKITAKAKYNIPGRNAEEQGLIDAVKKEMDQLSQAEGESGVQAQGAIPRVEGLETTSRFEPPREDVAPVEGIKDNVPPEAAPPKKDNTVANLKKLSDLTLMQYKSDLEESIKFIENQPDTPAYKNLREDRQRLDQVNAEIKKRGLNVEQLNEKLDQEAISDVTGEDRRGIKEKSADPKVEQAIEDSKLPPTEEHKVMDTLTLLKSKDLPGVLGMIFPSEEQPGKWAAKVKFVDHVTGEDLGRPSGFTFDSKQDALEYAHRLIRDYRTNGWGPGSIDELSLEDLVALSRDTKTAATKARTAGDEATASRIDKRLKEIIKRIDDRTNIGREPDYKNETHDILRDKLWRLKQTLKVVEDFAPTESKAVHMRRIIDNIEHELRRRGFEPRTDEERAVDAVLNSSRTSNVPEALSKADLEHLDDRLLQLHAKDLEETLSGLRESKASDDFVREAERQLMDARGEMSRRGLKTDAQTVDDFLSQIDRDFPPRPNKGSNLPAPQDAGSTDVDPPKKVDWRIDYRDKLSQLTDEQLLEIETTLKKRHAEAEPGSTQEELLHRDLLNTRNERIGRGLKEPSAADESRPATSEPASTEESTRGAPEEPTPTEGLSTAGTRTGSESQLDGIPKGKPGVTIEAADPPEAGSFVVARDKRGNPIGYLLLEKIEGKAHRAMEVFVDEAHRRKGVATSMYKAAKDAGLDIVSGDFGLSEEGAALVKNLNDKGIVNAVRTTPSELNVHGDATVPVEAPKPKQTFLESVTHKKPLEELTEKQLDKLDDKIMKAIEKEKPGTEKYRVLQKDLDKLMENQRRLNEEAKAAKQAPPPEEGPVDFSAPERGTAPKAVEESSRLLGEHARTLMKKSLRTMNIDDLKLHIEDLKSRLRGMTQMEGQEYRARLSKAMEEIAERQKGDQGFTAQVPPGVGGAGLGFAYGYMKDPDQDEDRMTNALEWAAIGAVGGTLAGKMLRRGQAPRLTVPENRLPSELPGGQWQAEARKTIVHDRMKGGKPVPFLERMRTIYNGIVRNSYTAERFQQSLGASRLPTELNAAKQFGMFGRFTGQTESALKYGPSVYDEFGNTKKLDAKGIGDILDMVDGDAESLGDLMAALTTMEQAGLVKNPMPLHVAERVFHAMPEKFHAAAAEARKFSLAMAQVAVDGGLIPPELIERFAKESFYAPMIRVFGVTNEKLLSADAEKIIARVSNPIKARTGGSSKAVISPFQSMVDMIPKIYRAAELNKIKNLWIDAWESGGKPGELMQRISKGDVKLSPAHDARIKMIQNELAVSRADAERMIAALEPSMIDPLAGIMKVYRNGSLESYRIPKDLAKAMINLAPDDMHLVVKALGLPSRVAVKGITMHPFFVAKMSFFDMWQATLNSQYGFRFGIDNVIGFLHAATDSKAYRNFLAAGGQHQALYGPSKSNFSTAIEDIKANKGSPLGVAFRHMRQMKPVDAWKALITPMSDAARVGEYLRAKAHGASDIEAVYAAKVVTANYNEAGSWGAMRALQHMTMFLGPALQVMDQATYRAGIHPFRAPAEGRARAATNYALKALVTIALPSWYFWHANKNDKEITDLRQTQVGRKYWFMRMHDGSIVRIPKPPVDGQIFGTTFEGILDKYYAGDPHGMDRISGAVLRDAAFNIMPTIGVIPYSLETNTNLGLGIPIVPEGDQDLELQYQGADKASWLARAVSKKVAPLASQAESQGIRTAATPAGIDFLINAVTGMLGQDVSLGVSQAVEQEATGYVPATAELPIIKRVLVDMPTENVRSVQDFYRRVEDTQRVSATINYLATHDPDGLMQYVFDNQANASLIPTYSKARQQIANIHRAITDIKAAPATVISPSDKRLYVDMLKKQIIDIARTLNKSAEQTDNLFISR